MWLILLNLMSPYSRYRPLPGSDGLSVLSTSPGCRQTPPSACRFLRWISKLSPQTVNKQTIGKLHIYFTNCKSKCANYNFIHHHPCGYTQINFKLIMQKCFIINAMERPKLLILINNTVIKNRNTKLFFL